MIEYWVVYHDVEDFGPRRSFEVMGEPPPEMGMVEEQLIIRGFRRKDIYIRWHHWLLDQAKLHLVTCTHEALTDHEVRRLAFHAIRFAEQQGN